MRDIETRSDIEFLMQAFYARLINDEAIGFIFTDIAHLDLNHHLPVIVDFWENILFHTGSYTRNAMEPHFRLKRQTKFEPHYFERWLTIFNETIYADFNGEKATFMITRAKSIAAIMQIKMSQINEKKLH